MLQGGLAALALAPLLQACGDDGSVSGGGGTEKIPSPDNPIRWDLSKANPAIESGLRPEPGSTLRIYNYADYLSPRMLKDFEKKYGVDIRLSTFNDADEALTKIASGNLEFDLYFPSYDSLGRLVQADLLRPLNQDYLPNTGNLWPGFHDPWYDLGCALHRAVHDLQHRHRLAHRPGPRGHRGRSTTPTTCFWDTDVQRRTWRSSTTGTPRWRMVLLRNGQLDINSTDPDDIAMVREQLLELRDTMKPKVTIGHVHRPARRAVRPVPDVVRATRSTRSTTCRRASSVDIMRYWFPEDGTRRGRQRPGRLPRAGQEPGGRPLLHQRPDGRGASPRRTSASPATSRR